MPWNDHDGSVPRCTEDQLLALARAKAQVLGQRRHRQLGMGVLSALLLVVGTVAVFVRHESGPDTKLETVAGRPDTPTAFVTTTSTSDAATTSTSSAAAIASESVESSATTSTVRLRPPPAAPAVTSLPDSPATAPSSEPEDPRSTTTTTLGCRNSRNPACGPQVWDPAPGPNQPLTVKVTVTPKGPVAGETVTFRVVVDDPDGGILQGYQNTVDYGDGTPFLAVGGHLDCFPGYGSWDSAPRPVHEELVFNHVYTNAGTYTAAFKFNTYGNCAYGPSHGTATPTITVAKAP